MKLIDIYFISDIGFEVSNTVSKAVYCLYITQMTRTQPNKERSDEHACVSVEPYSKIDQWLSSQVSRSPCSQSDYIGWVH